MSEFNEKSCSICGYTKDIDTQLDVAYEIDCTISNFQIYPGYGSDFDGKLFYISEDIGLYSGDICDQCVKLLLKNNKLITM